MKTTSMIKSSGLLPQWRYLLGVYLLGMAGFTFFRLLTFGQEFYQIQYLPEGDRFWPIVLSFLMGLRFDTVTAAYLLLPAFLLLLISSLRNGAPKWLYYLVFGITTPMFLFAFFVCAADLPYFHHFNMRTNMGILISAGTGDSDFLWEMVWGEWRYYWTLAPLLLTTWFFVSRHFKLLRKTLLTEGNVQHAPTSKPIMTLGMAALFAGAMWGRVSIHGPISPASAYFSDYGFPNMLSLNPFYTFFLSWKAYQKPENNRVHFMDEYAAVSNVQSYLKLGNQEFESPIARRVSPDSVSGQKPNVVIVMMESMSADKMGRFGNPNNLTPFMDSLANESLMFDSIFSAGIHTFAGVYATLESMPVVKRSHPLVEMKPHAGIAQTLKQQGYQTIYFTTHDEQFDHVGAFLRGNGFDRIVAQPDYPPEKVVSALGVPDDYLYEHAIGEFNKLDATGKPFFGALMTGSDHGPYVIPKYFKPKHKERINGIVEYVDWSVSKFLKEASAQPWFDNTIFVFLGDHGVTVEKHYDLPLSFNHIPMIVYAPKLLGAPRRIGKVGSQMDAYPTLMGLLSLPYVNNTLGIDLMRQDRPYAITYADNKYAVLDKHYLYISLEYGVNLLYNYSTGSQQNVIEKEGSKAADMRKYAESMYQTAQYMREHNLTNWLEP